MLQKIQQDERCIKCIRNHCVNRHSGRSTQSKSCFIKSGCADCKFFSVCINPSRDKSAFDLNDRFFDSRKIPSCFVGPFSCNECYKNSHCQNKHLKAFKLNIVDPSSPQCFSGYHSTK